MSIFQAPPVILINDGPNDANDVMSIVNQIIADGNANAQPLGVTPTYGHGQCYLSYASPSQLLLSTHNGNSIIIHGAFYILPGSGIAIPSTNVLFNGANAPSLTPSTLFYVYLFNNNGVLTPDLSFTGHITDAVSGVEVKSGDSTRTLIGMFKTDGAGAFIDSGANRLVASWFNPVEKISGGAFTANRTRANTTPGEPSSEIRANYLNFAGRVVEHIITGTFWNTTGGAGTFTGIGVDGATPEDCVISGISSNASDSLPLSTAIKTVPSEGAHYSTLLGSTTGVSTGVWAGAAGAGSSRCVVRATFLG